MQRPAGTLSGVGVYSTGLKVPLGALAAGLGDHKIVTTLCPGGKERMRRLMSAIESGRADLGALVRTCLFAPTLGHVVVYGASANRERWWDNGHAAFLGWTPHDSSEPHRARVEAQPPLAEDDPARRYQGGAFVKAGPFETLP